MTVNKTLLLSKEIDQKKVHIANEIAQFAGKGTVVSNGLFDIVQCWSDVNRQHWQTSRQRTVSCTVASLT